MTDIQLRGWSIWTIKSCKYTLDLFTQCLDNSSLKDVGNNELKKFLLYLKERPGRNGEVSNETIRKHFNNLSSFFEYLEDEEIIVRSIIPKFKKRYLSKSFRKGNDSQTRQILDLEQMQKLMGSILDPHDKAMFVLLAKTGIRAHELVSIDIDDVSLEDLSLYVKSTGKRKGMTIFFDYETKRLLDKWMRLRAELTTAEKEPLFITKQGHRISQTILNKRLKKYAEMLGYHDPGSNELEKRFTAHCFRHFFTTQLLNSGMSRDYVKELRGDSRSDTIDIYHHITAKDLKREYLNHIPQFKL